MQKSEKYGKLWERKMFAKWVCIRPADPHASRLWLVRCGGMFIPHHYVVFFLLFTIIIVVVIVAENARLVVTLLFFLSIYN